MRRLAEITPDTRLARNASCICSSTSKRRPASRAASSRTPLSPAFLSKAISSTPSRPSISLASPLPSTQVMATPGRPRCRVRISGSTWVASPKAERRKMHTDFTAASSFTWYTLGMADSGDRQAFAAGTSADRVSILHDAALLPDIGPDQFNASGYSAAEPVSGSGRGGAWFVPTAAGDAVLKHYRRGGKATWLSEDAYFYLGDARVRSFAEYRLLRRLREA